nr:hypothetical protein [uncultured Mediterranean phage uvMED]
MMFQIDEIATGNLIDHLVSGHCVECDAINGGLPVSSEFCVTKVVA